MAYYGTAVLPVGESLNPFNPDTTYTYFDLNQTVYVMWKLDEARTRPTRVLTSFGPLKGWEIDSVHDLHHDQTGAQMGSYKVVGVHHFRSGEMAGNVPDIKIKHAVFK